MVIVAGPTLVSLHFNFSTARALYVMIWQKYVACGSGEHCCYNGAGATAAEATPTAAESSNNNNNKSEVVWGVARRQRQPKMFPTLGLM